MLAVVVDIEFLTNSAKVTILRMDGFICIGKYSTESRTSHFNMNNEVSEEWLLHHFHYDSFPEEAKVNADFSIADEAAKLNSGEWVPKSCVGFGFFGIYKDDEGDIFLLFNNNEKMSTTYRLIRVDKLWDYYKECLEKTINKLPGMIELQKRIDREKQLNQENNE
jgi:hypothetical protein